MAYGARLSSSAEEAGVRRLDESLTIRDGTLFVEDSPAPELARRFGTPLHVASEDQLRRNVHHFEAAFSRWPGELLLLPSIKANPSLALRRILTEAGTGCDVFGAGELDAALCTGTDPDLISLNGPMKDEALLERAVRAGVRVTLDSRGELERIAAVAARVGRRALVRFRVRPDLVGVDQPSEMSPEGLSVRAAVQRYKAGIPTEDLLAITADEVHDAGLDVRGIHLHLGRHSDDPNMWGAAIDSLAQLLARLRERWSWTPSELDLGGGFPSPRDPFGRRLPLRANAPARAPELNAYSAAICARLERRLEELEVSPAAVRLELEPGRALYANAGIHLATVGNVKRQTEPWPITWVETDSSDAYLPDVNLELNRWTCIAAENAAAKPEITADVTGRTCALDVIVPDAQLPSIQIGDVLAFLDTGAYQDAAASNFNALPRPGTVLISGEGAEMIRRHETPADVFARDLIPERLRVRSPALDGAAWRATGLDHFAVTSADLDRSLDFYSGLLGMEVRDCGDATGGDFDITGIADASVRWADLELDHGQILELIEYAEPQGKPIRPAPNDPGATHVSVRVENVDATYERLVEAGVTVRGRPTTLEGPGAWAGARAFYAADPDGVTVELIQPARPTPDR
jgi:diaminopimelate decarboxylase